MFKPKYLKQAKLLKKGVRKFLHYKEDVIEEETMGALQAKLSDFDEAVASKDKEAIKDGAKRLTRACEKAVPPSNSPGLRENLEVIFVAVIIAVGIRAYVVQPFRIPTGSMQPTLNGIIAYQHDAKIDGEFDRPGLFGRAFEKVTQGRTYVDFTIPAGAEIEAIEEVTQAKFFTWTKIHFKDPTMESLSPYVPIKTLIGDFRGSGFGLRAKLGLEFERGRGASGAVVETGRVVRHRAIEEDLVVRGYLDTGDQVLVNKVSYHFRPPKRGEVFVFNTRSITGIRIDNPAHGSQHYIKRLTGLPGDILEIERQSDSKVGGPLYVNGSPAEEPQIRKVWEDYPGYVWVDRHTAADGKFRFELAAEPGDRRYMAMGDNSANSSDSRMWGGVPEQNLVGPALMVYWPFEHFGRIR